MTNTEEFDRLIGNSGVKLSAICDAAGMTYATLRAKKNNESDFTVSEIMAICSVVHWDEATRDRVFFYHEA